MRTTSLLSPQLLEGARNCVLSCGGIKDGDNVLILNLVDHVYWPTDELAVEALSTVAQEAGAHVEVLWTSGMEKGYWEEVPKITLGAIRSADVVISNTKRIMRPQKAIREVMFKMGITWVRNMCTTAQQLSGEWARFPFELSDEITRWVGERLDQSSSWRVTHPNGTDIQGKTRPPATATVGHKRYGERRRQGKNRPFPQGCFNPFTCAEANGVIVVERCLPAQAKYMGVPLVRFESQVKFTIENTRIVHIEGEREAELIRRFYESVEMTEGEKAWSLAGFHAGINPKARVYESPDRFPEAWVEGPHNNPRVMHFHIGAPGTSEHISAGMTHISYLVGDLVGDGATIYFDGEKLYDRGHLVALDAPEIREFAAKSGDPDILLAEVPPA